MDASLKPGARGPHPTAAIMRAGYSSEAWEGWIGRLCALRHEMRLHQLLDEWEQRCLREQRLALKGGQTSCDHDVCSSGHSPDGSFGAAQVRPEPSRPWGREGFFPAFR